MGGRSTAVTAVFLSLFFRRPAKESASDFAEHEATEVEVQLPVAAWRTRFARTVPLFDDTVDHGLDGTAALYWNVSRETVPLRLAQSGGQPHPTLWQELAYHDYVTDGETRPREQCKQRGQRCATELRSSAAYSRGELVWQRWWW
jgi:hypothetical protein